MEVGVANAADVDVDADLTGAGLGERQVGQLERLLLDGGRFAQDYGFHVAVYLRR